MIKSTINLLQPELKPEKPLVTLNNAVSVWLVTLVVMVAFAAYSAFEQQSYAEQATALSRENTKLLERSEQLQQRLASHKPSAELLAELDTLKALTSDKRDLFQQLTNSDQSYITGFASAMQELAKLHRNDISLQHISIEEGAISFSGQARNAQAVPQWLNQFERSPVLSGKAFEHMEMKEMDDSAFIDFTVRANGRLFAESSVDVSEESNTEEGNTEEENNE